MLRPRVLIHSLCLTCLPSEYSRCCIRAQQICRRGSNVRVSSLCTLTSCPVLVTPKMADAATAERLGIQGDVCRSHLKALRDYRARDAAAFTAKIQAIAQRHFEPHSDPDLMLYSGGFFSAER